MLLDRSVTELPSFLCDRNCVFLSCRSSSQGVSLTTHPHVLLRLVCVELYVFFAQRIHRVVRNFSFNDGREENVVKQHN